EWLRVGTIDDFPLLGAAELPIRGIPDPLDPDSPLPPPPAAFPVPAAPAATPGLANILLDGSTVTGSAFTAPGSVSNVIMRNNSLWNVTGNSNVTFLLNDPSLIDFSPPVGDPTLLSSYKTLTTVDYVGEDGQIAFNTYLGADGSPSDILVIDGGTATGSTGVIVRNTTGPGGLTVADGILIVDTINGATSTPTAFSLIGDYVTPQGQQAVVGGAFAYTLNYGGVDANTTDNNWYLRSVLQPTPPGPGPTPDDPGPLIPLYQAGVPLYEVYPQNLLALGGLPTMQQRVGNRYWEQPASVEEIFCKDPSQNFKCRVSSEQASYYLDGSQVVIDGTGVWTRLEGSHIKIEPAETTSGTDYDTDLWKLQAGFDGMLYEAQDGSRLIGGVTVHYGQANTDVTSIYGDGSIDTDGYGFGGNLTWLAQNGFYVDGQASLTWFNSDLDSDTANRGLTDGNDGFGYALSIETGKKIDLSDNWTVTPQVQLVYASVDFDDFTDAFGADVSLDKAKSLRGRLGISADRDQVWKDDAGKTKRSHIYGIANLYYEFLGESRVDVSGTKFETRPERLWGGVGVGGSYNWNDDKYSIYGEVSANTSLESFGDSYALNGTAGFRVKW
uniref:autotransporter family protein n=1 Tax=Candidatus Phyllobacterium onerii TaxID=3020828 RepID=UPI0023309EE3